MYYYIHYTYSYHRGAPLAGRQRGGERGPRGGGGGSPVG